MNSAALFADESWLPGAVARWTRTNFTAPGCLASDAFRRYCLGCELCKTVGRTQAVLTMSSQ